MAKKPTYEELEQKVKKLEGEAIRLKNTEDGMGKLAHVVDAMVDVVVIIDLQGRISYVNRAAAGKLAYKNEELIGKTPGEFIAEKDLTKFTAQVQEILSGKPLPKSIECLAKHKEGKEIPMCINFSFLYDREGKPKEIIAVCNDISERKLAEGALVRSNRAHKMLSECIQTLVRGTNEGDLLHQICRIIVEVGGYRLAWVGFAEQDEGKRVRSVAQTGFEERYLESLNITWADRERGQGPVGMAIRSGEPRVARNIQTAPGFVLWREAAIQRGYASCIALPLFANEKVFGALAIYSAEPDAFDAEELKLLTDLAENLGYGVQALRTKARRERVELELMTYRDHLEDLVKDRTRALRESEGRYRSMMISMKDPVYICSPDFHIAYMNLAMARRIGSDAIGEYCYKNLHGFNEKCPWCVHEKIQQGEYVDIEVVSPKDNRSYLVSNSPIYHSDGSISKMTIYRDITEPKLLGDQLIRSERLAATGQLAASIAHEINSPLQGITSIIGLIEETYKQDKTLSENLNVLKSGFASIGNTVRRLLDLNRPDKETKQSMNVDSVIEDTVSVLKGYLKNNKVKVNLDLSSRIPNITASPQQLGQVFLNLINNAVEAMSAVTKRKDGWMEQEPIGREITINTRLRDENIVIKVADTGPGISKEDMEHIFDPFYTKRKKMGMGIGLSLCHSIIEDHNGSIAAKNSPEGGAVFTITLPVG